MKTQKNYRGYEILCRTCKTYIAPCCSSLHLMILTFDYNYCFHFLYHRCPSGFLLRKSRGNPDTTIFNSGKFSSAREIVLRQLSENQSFKFQPVSSPQSVAKKRGQVTGRVQERKRRPSSIIQIQQVAGPAHSPPTFSDFSTDQEPGTGYWKRLLKFKTEPTVFTFYTLHTQS